MNDLTVQLVPLHTILNIALGCTVGYLLSLRGQPAVWRVILGMIHGISPVCCGLATAPSGRVRQCSPPGSRWRSWCSSSSTSHLSRAHEKSRLQRGGGNCCYANRQPTIEGNRLWLQNDHTSLRRARHRITVIRICARVPIF
jgi:hypothetical protein